MDLFLNNPRDKVLMAALIDQSFRSEDPERVAEQINFLMRKYGVPDFFSVGDKLLMRIFLGIGRHFPHVSVPRVMGKVRDDSSRSVIPGEKWALENHLKARARDGVITNINHLGEAVLGEAEALTRLAAYVNDLKSPHFEYISVKISTLYSQISSLAFEHTVDILVERLSRLLRAARDHHFTRADGTRVPKFVNLDMEAYRDLEITVAAFTKALDRPEFANVSAGLALQSYLPDSYGIQQKLTRWARDRVDRGGSPIKIRIVKGANLEMEKVESALQNWFLAPYDNKLDVDAAFKRMIRYGVQPENIRAVHMGVGSHNLFDLAYSFVLARNYRVLEHFSVEMLEGMADHVRRAIQETATELVLYAPVATREQFVSAIAYLIRRLDENTGEENFLRHACHLEYYALSACHLEEVKGLNLRGRGVGLVLSPWNFPIAIPCCGIAASLAAGNTVLLKPASSAVLTAWVLCQCFWRAGIGQHTLQFVPCPGAETGEILTTHPDVDFVILTGGTETALKIQKGRPHGLLAAETGGKNRHHCHGHGRPGPGNQKCGPFRFRTLGAEVFGHKPPDPRKRGP